MSQATATFIGQAAGTGTPSTVSLPSYNQAAGHCIVVFIHEYSGTAITAVNDTAGNSYVQLGSNVTDADGGVTSVWYAADCLGNSGNVITPNKQIVYGCLFGYDVANADALNPVNASLFLNGASGSSTKDMSSDAGPNGFMSLTATLQNCALLVGNFEKGQKTCPFTAGTITNLTQIISNVLTSGSIPANFTQVSGTWADSASNGAYASSGGGVNFLVENSESYNADQWAQTVVESTGGGTPCGPAVRCSLSAATGYAIYVSGSGTIELVKVISGVQTPLATASVPYAAGKVVTLVAQGTTISAFFDGNMVCQVTDSSIASGSAGLYSYGSGSSSLGVQKNFAAGNVPSSTSLTLDGQTGTGGDQGDVQSANLTTFVPSNAFIVIPNSANAGWPFIGVAVVVQPPQTSVATPTITPGDGIYSSAQSVSLSCSTPGATIHYTTDGTTPTTSSPVYTTPISVLNGTTQIKAVAAAPGYNNSGVASATITISGAGPGVPGGNQVLPAALVNRLRSPQDKDRFRIGTNAKFLTRTALAV